MPIEFDAEVRVPRLSKRRVTVRDRIQDCLTDYQWLFWDKIDRLNKSQRKHSRADTTHRSARSKKKGSGPAVPAITTQVVDNVYIVHDPAGSLVTQVGMETTINFVEAYRQFRREFGDDYDFLAFFVDTQSGMPDIGNGSTPIFSDVTGIGRPVPDTRADWKSAKLRLCSHFTWVTLRTMLHEPAHLWCSYVHYRLSANGPPQSLLHADFAGASDQSGLHWGRFVDDGVSCMDYDRCDWDDNHDGTFHRFNHRADETSPVRAKRFGYCPLDLYLMGLIGPEEVPPWTMICDPTPQIDDNIFGPYTPAAPGAFQLDVQNVIFEEGPRAPDYLNSPRVFHQATIIVTKDADPDAFFIAEVAADQAEHVPNFRCATRGLAMMDCSLLCDNHSDLYIKHTPADHGTPSQSGDYFNSPDLWVRNNPDGKTNFDSQMPIPGQDNWIYARVRNKGARPYQNVKVDFYVTSTSHLDVRYPNDWHPDRLIGTAIDTVPPASGRGSSRADGFAILEVRWPSELIPAPAGEIASVLCEIIPMGVEPTKLHAVWENPKLAQRLLA